MLPEVLAILFVATFVRSAFGFGEALIAVPLLALFMPIEVAAPLSVLVSITVSSMVLTQDWRHVHVRAAGWLVASTLPGIPVGLWLMVAAPEAVAKAVLAALIIAFSAFLLAYRRPAVLETERWAPLFGFVAGVLGGAYGMNGPPLVAFGTLRRWSPQHFRATLQGYFLPASLVIMAGFGMAGLWTPIVTDYYLKSLPVVVSAVLVGRLANRRVDPRTFLVIVHVGLVAVGLMLLWQAYARG